MDEQKPKKSGSNRLSLRYLSIRQQLPLLICLLLLIVIVLFGTISYMGVRRASLGIGQQRLKTLTEQLSSLFQQNMKVLATGTKAMATRQEVIDYLGAAPDRRPSSDPAMAVLQKLLADSQTVRVELYDLQGKEVLYAETARARALNGQTAGVEGAASITRPDASKEITDGGADSSFAGKFYRAGDSLYFPIIVRITAGGRALGYLIRWRPVRATPQAIAQLSQLIGAKAAFYFGNKDGSLWTDLLRPVAAPVMATASLRNIVSYRSPDNGNKVIAYSLPVTGSKWTLMVELSEAQLLETANRFLYWMVGIGVFLIVIGSLIAWFISRSFTRPLEELQRATAAIAAGDHSSPVAVHRRDELGKLAASFNSMAVQVFHAREELEHRVSSRTQELEAVNKELEAFSYSVSHDLRAPLRAVSGYAMMLKEDYEDSFDDEAKRITGNILSNVKMMGRLIDDLIGFSRLGKREVRRQAVDMKALAELCVAELSPLWPEGKFVIDVGSLPVCMGDEDLLKQVWMNLIGNAMKYSSKNAEARITVGSMKERGAVEYFIRDNGTGLDMRYADKLFKVFQRLHSQEEFEGTGVGLALVKRILDKHGGEIRVESSPGNGATFSFRIPG